MDRLRPEDLTFHLERELEQYSQRVDTELAMIRRVGAEVADVAREGGVWQSAQVARMCDVSLEIVRGGCEHRHDDPALVYARPLFIAVGERIHFARDYAVATLTPGALEPESGWEAAMRADGLSDAVVRTCRCRLHALAPAAWKE